MKRFITMLCLLATLSMQAQNADERIGMLMNESRWFELAHELQITSVDSVNPLLGKMAAAMTCHYFNRPDSACMLLGDLLNNHQEALGNNTLSMAVLMGMNLARTDHYTEAAALMHDLCDQMEALGADSTQTRGLLLLAQQYRVFADNAPVCQPLHQAGTYTVPMGIHNDMHTAKGRISEGYCITMDGRINGHESTLVFDTGAGVNVMSSVQARDCGLRLLDAEMPMSGIGTQQGRYAMADTLNIGDMAWSNVPFLIVDIQTGNARADSIGAMLPPVIGLPVMFRMQEIQLDFEHRQFVIPAVPSPCLASGSNLLRTDSENLRLVIPDNDGQPLYFLFDTGGYNTVLLPRWYERHKAEVQATCVPDSLREAGVGGIKITRSYRLPHKEFRIGQGTAVLDSVIVDTGIDLHSGEERNAHNLDGVEDGTIGLNLLERFKVAILNLKEMYLDAIPY